METDKNAGTGSNSELNDALGTADDLAFTCECGSVHFNLLKSKYLECAKCGVRYRGLSWFALRKF